MLSPQQRYSRGRWSPASIALKIGLPVLILLLILLVVLLAGVSWGDRDPDPPDVANLTLVSAGNGTFTLAWEQPEGIVDQYWVQVSARAASGDDDGDGERRAGLCANGTILRSDQTRLTCGDVEPCTNVTVTVRVLNFPRRHSATKFSDGVRLPIFFPGYAPDTPKNVSIVAASPTETRILWEPVLSHTDEAVLYDVRLCDTSGPCDAANPEECAQFTTPNTSLDLSSAVANRRCLLIGATTQCAGQVLRSSPFVLETLVQIPTV
ncbi:uncharacterized protein [Dermacentor andersoni]|uniref:uncharacterized protein n=1 Tax=Dermacentor andersoni TaxID=34620 RepID=UPI002417A921|nr:uncharacterized protein LOC126544304 [Dermacentor andersoni]